MAKEKHGIVYIADFPDGWPSEFTYEGHWESPETRQGVVEAGPGWDDPDKAIKWGRERAPIVFVRIGTTIYSAGDEDPEDEIVPRWESRPI